MESIGFVESHDISLYEAPSISLGEKPDPQQMEIAVKKNLEERVVADLTTEKITRYHLDHCVNITSYTELFRQKMAQTCQEVVKFWTNVRTVVSLASGAALLAAVYVPMLGLLTLIGIVGFAYSHYRASKALQSIESWNTVPYQKPAQQRALAYTEPFLPFYRLQGTPLSLKDVLHPNEVEYLYKKYLTSFVEKLLQEKPSSDGEKKTWMANFLTLNPLSPGMMRYGWEKIPSAMEEISKDYGSLFAETPTYSQLSSKFVSLFESGPAGSIGRTGMFHSPSYLYDLEGLVLKYEQQLENLKFDYVQKREGLKSQYAQRLEELAPESSPQALQHLKDQFDYDLKHVKDPATVQCQSLKTKYLEDLQELKNQYTRSEPHALEDRLETRWNELQIIFIEDQPYATHLDQYEEAKALLERAKKGLNPPVIVKEPPKKISEPPSRKPRWPFLDDRNIIYFPI